MTKVTIRTVVIDDGSVTYFADSKGKHSHGTTAGRALDALTAQMTHEETGTMVIVIDDIPSRDADDDVRPVILPHRNISE